MSNHVLTESDLLTLFSSGKKVRNKNFKKFLKIFGLIVFLYVTIFLVLNWQSLKEQFSYWYNVEYKTTPVNQFANIDTAEQVISVEKGIEIKSLKIDDNHLAIDSIGVNAPITWRIENKEEDVRLNLQNGLIHINGTALPGEKGNVFITGHSSDLPWSKGNYKTVFSLLNKVAVGELVQLKYQNRDYIYKVKDVKVVSPDNLSVLDATSEPTLTLMTCTPVGTTLKRLIIIANQIHPGAQSNTKAITNKPNPTKELPKVR